MRTALLVSLSAVLLFAPSTGANTSKPSALAASFLASLSTSQRQQVVQSLDSADRRNWHYIPRRRRGLPLGRMSEAQRRSAYRLVDAVLSLAVLWRLSDVRLTGAESRWYHVFVPPTAGAGR